MAAWSHSSPFWVDVAKQRFERNPGAFWLSQSGFTAQHQLSSL